MLESDVPPTLKKLSETLKISTKTAHVWKHKLLASLNQVDEISLDGDIEMDEVFLPFCVKGYMGDEKTPEIIKKEKFIISTKKNSAILCIHNRNDDFDFYPIRIMQKGNPGIKFVEPILDELIFKEDTTVITDESRALGAYFDKNKEIEHQTFKADGDKTSRLHNNNINNVMAAYRRWSKHFNGYSTKYVWNYLKWFRFHKKFKKAQEISNVIIKSVKDIGSAVRYKSIPRYYEDFLYTI